LIKKAENYQLNGHTFGRQAIIYSRLKLCLKCLHLLKLYSLDLIWPKKLVIIFLNGQFNKNIIDKNLVSIGIVPGEGKSLLTAWLIYDMLENHYKNGCNRAISVILGAIGIYTLMARLAIV
jgi:hypothetical protein